MATILNYDEQGFIVGSAQLESGMKALSDDTQEIIKILKAQNQIANTRMARVASNAERIAQRNTTGRTRNSANTSPSGQGPTRTSSSNTSNSDSTLRGVTRRAPNHRASPSPTTTNTSPNSTRGNTPRERDENGRFVGGRSRSSDESLLKSLRSHAGVHGGGVGSAQGVDPLVDSLNEAKSLLSPVTRGAGMAGRAVKWSWSKFKSMKRREPLPRDEERHNRNNEKLLTKILRQLMRGGRSGGGIGLGGLLGRGALGAGAGLAGLLGAGAGLLGKGGKSLLGGLGKLKSMKFLGPIAALAGVADLAMNWGDMDHAGKSGGVGALAGGGGGALAGAALGTMIFPGVGTVVGGALGAWLGSEGGEWLGTTASPYIESWTTSLKNYNLADKMKGVWEGGMKPFFTKLGDIGTQMGSWIERKLRAAGDFLGITNDDEGLGAGVTAKANKAADLITQNALEKSSGYCAKFVRKGLQEAGYDLKTQEFAYQYGNGALVDAGFTNIDPNAAPQKGDIMVMPAQGKHSAGHIQMYNGEQWVSDFKQKSRNPWGDIADENLQYKLYRDIKPAAVAPKGASSNARTAQAMSFFMKKGWTKEQAAGLVANLQRESGYFDEDVISGSRTGDGGKAVGIGQWHPPRQNDFKNQYKKNLKGSSFEEQLEFTNFELTKGKEKAAGDRLRKATTAAQAGSIVSEYYERPEDKFGERAKRADMAEAVNSNYVINTGTTSKAKPTSSATGFSLGGMAQPGNSFAPAATNFSTPLPNLPISKLLQFPTMPKVSQRLDSGGQKPIIIQANNDTISQNVSDRGIAHAITGGLGQDRYWG
jgi:hypothetical protein